MRYRLGDVSVQIIDGDRGKNYPNEFKEKGYCLFLSAKNVTITGFEFSEKQFITKERDELLRKGKLLRNDVVLTTRGTVGNVAIYNDSVPYDHIRINSGMVILRADTKTVEPQYLYYLMKSADVQGQIVSMRTGSAQPQFPISHMVNLEIDLPPLPVQREISAMLTALDARIAENRAINNHLEQMAQAIFKSWFVDFEPWGGVMPDDWRRGSLLDIANYLNGLAMQRFRPTEGEVGLPVLKIKELRQGFCDSSSELCSSSIRSDYIVHDGDVIFSWSGSLLIDFWCGGDCGLNQHLFKVNSTKYDKWFYYGWTCHHLDQFIAIAADKATTMGHIKREALANAEVLIPTDNDYVALGELMAPLYEQIINNRVENRKLALLRDTLLPRLMSGELSVEGPLDD